jgi:hypothetical protein
VVSADLGWKVETICFFDAVLIPESERIACRARDVTLKILIFIGRMCWMLVVGSGN